MRPRRILACALCLVVVSTAAAVLSYVRFDGLDPTTAVRQALRDLTWRTAKDPAASLTAHAAASALPLVLPVAALLAAVLALAAARRARRLDEEKKRRKERIAHLATFVGSAAATRATGFPEAEPPKIPLSASAPRDASQKARQTAQPAEQTVQQAEQSAPNAPVGRANPLLSTIATRATLDRHRDASPDSQAPRQTVLIADDDPIILKVYTRLLEDAGFRALTATSGTMAYEVVVKERPAAAVIDYRLPLLSGIQICEKIRREPKLDGTRLVLFTIDEQSRTREEALRVGADAVVTKVDEPAVLIGTLLGMLR